VVAIHKRVLNNLGGAGIAQWYSAGIRAGWSEFRVPVGARNFSPHYRVQTDSGAPIQWVPVVLSLGVKRPRLEVDHSPPSTDEVKNEWIYISTPSIRLNGVVKS
jgi:hypothetical protein